MRVYSKPLQLTAHGPYEAPSKRPSLDARGPLVDSTTVLVHEPKKAISCEELEFLISSGYRQHRSLRVLKHDYEMVREGVQLIFPLDFSEIYTYLWPSHSRASNQYLVQMLLESKTLTFTLLPGTVFEFVRYLYRRTPLHTPFAQRIKKHIDAINLEVTIDAFVNGRSPDEVDLSSLADEAHQLQQSLTTIAHLHAFYKRLEFINSTPNLVSFKSILGRVNEVITPDIEVFGRCITQLGGRRPAHMEINNFIDAHNYALTWRLSDSLYRTTNPTVCILATSSYVPYDVFRSIKWPGFKPRLVQDPFAPELSLARHTIQAYYLDRLLSADYRDQERLHELLSSLDHILRCWSRIPEFIQYRRGEIAPNQQITLPTDRAYISNYMTYLELYSRLFERVRSALHVDMISDENVRRAKDVEFGPIGARNGLFESFHLPLRDIDKQSDARLDESPTPELMRITSPRLIFNLLDDLTRLTIEQVATLRGGLEGIPPETLASVDVHGLIHKANKLITRSSTNQRFDCVEFVASYRHTDRIYLWADIYPSHYSIWWEPRVTFHEFIECVKLYLHNLNEHAYQYRQYLTGRAEKFFDGIYLMPEAGDRPIHVNFEDVPDLDADTILAWAEGRPLRTVRVASKYADYCYDFKPSGRIPRRVGVISDFPTAAPLINIIQLSNRSDVSLVETRRIVNRVMKRYLSLRKDGER